MKLSECLVNRIWTFRKEVPSTNPNIPMRTPYFKFNIRSSDVCTNKNNRFLYQGYYILWLFVPLIIFWSHFRGFREQSIKIEDYRQYSILNQQFHSGLKMEKYCDTKWFLWVVAFRRLFRATRFEIFFKCRF